MALIAVNGTPLQPAIDAAQPGDILVPKAGGYAGRLRITKGVSIKGDGAVVIDGGTGDGFVNIDVAAKAVTLSGLDLRHAGAAFRFQGDCTGSLVENVTIPVVDWMIVNNGLADNGGNGFQFVKATGVEVRYCDMRLLRAVSKQYTVDGGAFEFFGASKINVHHNEVWDSVNMAESGRNSTTPDNTDITITDNTFHGRPDPLTATTDKAKLVNGMYLRALNRATIARNTFDLIDHWAILFSTGGTYGGGMAAVSVTDNIFRLAPGSNRMLYSSGIPFTAFTIDRNKVYTTASTARVAEVNGVKYYATDIAAFRTDTGFEKASTWTVGPLPPIAPIPAPAPVDPCASVKAERDAAVSALALANSTVASLTTERDTLALKVANAKAALA
jgi:hypothetical protein